jgi:hypothetical protein
MLNNVGSMLTRPGVKQALAHAARTLSSRRVSRIVGQVASRPAGPLHRVTLLVKRAISQYVVLVYAVYRGKVS